MAPEHTKKLFEEHVKQHEEAMLMSVQPEAQMQPPIENPLEPPQEQPL